MTSPRRALLPTFATLGLAASALAQADGWPLQAQVLLAPARHAAAEGFDPAPVCATFSVPLAEGWNVLVPDPAADFATVVLRSRPIVARGDHFGDGHAAEAVISALAAAG